MVAERRNASKREAVLEALREERDADGMISGISSGMSSGVQGSVGHTRHTARTINVSAQSLVMKHRHTVRKRLLVIAMLALIALAMFTVSTLVGPVHVDAPSILRAVLTPEAVPTSLRVIVWDLRLPMSVMALLVGMALSLAGAQMQTILSNPLAEPFTLGISAAAALGGASAIVLGVAVLPNQQFNVALMAWVAAMLVTGVIVAAAVARGASAESVILLGIALVFLCNALLALIKYRATAEALQQIVFWTMGSLSRATWQASALLAVVLAVCVPIFAALSWQLTALSLGDARAASMGVKVRRLRVGVLALVSVLAATAVAFTGIIGFVGLVGPHIARMLVGEDQRYFMPASMAAGAAVLCAAHALSIVIIPGLAVPIGIITSLIGVPFFVMIVMTRRAHHHG